MAESTKYIKLPSGTIIEMAQFVQAIEFYTPRVYTIKELVDEVDKFFMPLDCMTCNRWPQHCQKCYERR